VYKKLPNPYPICIHSEDGTAMFAKMLENPQNSVQLIPEHVCDLYLHSKFHMSLCSSSLVITAKMRAKDNFYITTKVFFKFYKKK
jgi:hypothetical protein